MGGKVSGTITAEKSRNVERNAVICRYEVEFDQDEIEDNLENSGIFEIHGSFYNPIGDYFGGLFRQRSPYKTTSAARKAAKDLIINIVNTKIENKATIERWTERAQYLKEKILITPDYITIPDFDRDAVLMKEHGKFLDEEDVSNLDDIVQIRQKCTLLIKAKATLKAEETAPKAASTAVEIKPRPMGRQSHGNVSKMVSLRIPVDLMDLLEAKAKETGTTRSSVILSILDSALNPRTPDLASIASPLCIECEGKGIIENQPCQSCFPPLDEEDHRDRYADHCDDRPPLKKMRREWFNIS